jgi:hypothetical protein
VQEVISAAGEGCLTLGVITGPLEAVEEQTQQKTKVVGAMQAQVALRHDAEMEYVLSRQSVGVGGVNHILRACGRELLEQGAAASFAEAARDAMNRLFPGLTAESHVEAKLSADHGGLGWRAASITAQPSNLGALTAAAPKVRSVAVAAAHAGLLRPGVVEPRLDARARAVEESYPRDLDEVGRTKAEDLMRRVRLVAEEQLRATAGGLG